ncbi:MAG: hypothetical protein K6L60_15375 [Oceanobacter sp.]
MRILKLCAALSLLGLAACSQLPTGSFESPTAIGTGNITRWHSNNMEDFAQGQFHPAVKALLQKAQQSRLQSNWQRSMTWLDQARQIAPRNAEVFLRQSWVALQMGDKPLTRQLAQRGLVFSDDAMTEVKLKQLVRESDK